MTIEAEIAAWHRERWPMWWPEGRLDPVRMVAKVAEEAGEVCGATIKMNDGTGRAKVLDLVGEVGDLLLCLAVLADWHGFTLADALDLKVVEHARSSNGR